MFINDHGSSASQFENFHLHLVISWTLARYECVRDVCALLMVIMSFVKKNLCWELHHLKLIFASTGVACVVGVWDHTTCSSSILEPASTFLFPFIIHHELFYTYKKNKDYTSCCKHWYDDHMHLCMFMYAICKCVDKCAYVKCECEKHHRYVKVCVNDNASMFANLISNHMKHNVSVQVCSWLGKWKYANWSSNMTTCFLCQVISECDSFHKCAMHCAKHFFRV